MNPIMHPDEEEDQDEYELSVNLKWLEGRRFATAHC